VGTPQDRTGVVARGGLIWGAGLAVRCGAWRALIDSGFTFAGTDRIRDALVSSGDLELCHALQIAGWDIHYCADLRLEHLISAERCEWDYFRRLYRGHGVSSVFLDPYGEISWKDLDSVCYRWWWRALSVCKQIVREPADVWAWVHPSGQGSTRVLRLEARIGRLLILCKSRGSYSKMLQRVQEWKLSVKPISGDPQERTAKPPVTEYLQPLS